MALIKIPKATLTPGLVLREVKGSELTIEEMDGNFTYLESLSAMDVVTVTESPVILFTPAPPVTSPPTRGDSPPVTVRLTPPPGLLWTTVPLSPSSMRTVVTMSVPLVENLYITADTSSCQLGDELYVSIIFDPGNANGFLWFDKNFYWTFCGNPTSFGSFGTEGNNLERITQSFFFDGEKFVCSYDNC